MNQPYQVFADVAAEIELPADGTVSRTLYQDERLKAILFCFSAGQELSEHTASSPAIMHFLSGEAEVTLGADRLMARAGAWIHMAPHLPHSISAKNAVKMLLLLLRSAAH